MRKPNWMLIFKYIFTVVYLPSFRCDQLFPPNLTQQFTLICWNIYTLTYTSQCLRLCVSTFQFIALYKLHELMRSWCVCLVFRFKYPCLKDKRFCFHLSVFVFLFILSNLRENQMQIWGTNIVIHFLVIKGNLLRQNQFQFK